MAGAEDAVMTDQDPKRKGMFADAGEEQASRRRRVINQEYRAAFERFDCSPRNGYIELNELGNVLKDVKHNVEAPGAPSMFDKPFPPATCCWLISKFGEAGRLALDQFCALCAYIKDLKAMFEQVDTSRDHRVEWVELYRAFQASGIQLDASTVAEVGRSYDADNSGTLEFDEFVQLRLEWDHYFSAWESATRGADHITPPQLLAVLEEIKRSLDPVGGLLRSMGGLEGFSLMSCLGLCHSINTQHPFQAKTCESLIWCFGQGVLCLNFNQFCRLLVFLKKVKDIFCGLDTGNTGTINSADLLSALPRAGIPLPPQFVALIGQSFNFGKIEFDDFVQIVTTWYEAFGTEAIFGVGQVGSIGPKELQRLMGTIRVLHKVAVDGTVRQQQRLFSITTCRWLIAKFGACRGGEAIAQRASFTEFLNLVQYLTECHGKFKQFDQDGDGGLSTAELVLIFASCGLHLEVAAVENIRQSYDHEKSGQIELDEFVHMLVECQLYEEKFNALTQSAPRLAPQDTLIPQGVTTPSGPPTVTLDKSAFLSLVFAVPRQCPEST